MAASQPIDPKAFKDFEHAGWQDVATQYHQYFADLTTQVIEPLLDAVQAGQGTRVLDVATGPGYAAAAAAQRGAEVIGIDFSSSQVKQARQFHPGATFQEGDAEALSFPESSFDAVMMNFGLLHFGTPERALQEAHRVLCSGGRIGFTVWAQPEEAVGLAITLRALSTHGNMNVPLPSGPSFFRFSDPDECRRVLGEIGFTNPEVVQVSQVWTFSTPDELFAAILEGTVRTASLLKAQTEEARQAIRTAMREAASAYARDGVTRIPMPAVLASATKP
jgi:ubiquinone/menaquinone biosynthesis C-methylase UbiE